MFLPGRSRLMLGTKYSASFSICVYPNFEKNSQITSDRRCSWAAAVSSVRSSLLCSAPCSNPSFLFPSLLPPSPHAPALVPLPSHAPFALALIKHHSEKIGCLLRAAGHVFLTSNGQYFSNFRFWCPHLYWAVFSPVYTYTTTSGSTLK